MLRVLSGKTKKCKIAVLLLVLGVCISLSAVHATQAFAGEDKTTEAAQDKKDKKDENVTEKETEAAENKAEEETEEAEKELPEKAPEKDAPEESPYTAEEVMAEIENLPILSKLHASDREKIEEIKEMYNAITQEQRDRVTNLEVLQMAEERVELIESMLEESYSSAFFVEEDGQVVLKVAYAEKEFPNILLVGPEEDEYFVQKEGAAEESVTVNTEINDDPAGRSVILAVSGAEEGVWSLMSSVPVSIRTLSTEDYKDLLAKTPGEDTSEPDTDSTEEPSSEENTEDTTEEESETETETETETESENESETETETETETESESESKPEAESQPEPEGESTAETEPGSQNSGGIMGFISNMFGGSSGSSVSKYKPLIFGGAAVVAGIIVLFMLMNNKKKKNTDTIGGNDNNSGKKSGKKNGKGKSDEDSDYDDAYDEDDYEKSLREAELAEKKNKNRNKKVKEKKEKKSKKESREEIGETAGKGKTSLFGKPKTQPVNTKALTPEEQEIERLKALEKKEDERQAREREKIRQKREKQAKRNHVNNEPETDERNIDDPFKDDLRFKKPLTDDEEIERIRAAANQMWEKLETETGRAAYAHDDNTYGNDTLTDRYGGNDDVVYVTQKDIDNDVTVEEFIPDDNLDDEEDDDNDKITQDIKKRRSFFPEDRFN